jgi:hypothetical protein
LIERVRLVSRVPPRAAAAVVLGALCFLAAFAAGRATGADEPAATPSLTPVAVANAGLALPQLSEAEALPELAPPVRRARPAPRAVVRPRPVSRPRPTAPRPKPAARRPAPAPPRPVVIVGSG